MPRLHQRRYSRVVVLICLLAAAADGFAFFAEAPLDAVEILTMFSGESAKQYEPLFRFAEETRIVDVEIHAVGTDSITARFSGRYGPSKQVNNILRLKSADGYEGISGVTSGGREFSREHLLEMKDAVDALLTLESLDPVEVGRLLEQTSPGLSDEARAGVDIALWDLAARRAELPLYELLGAKRDSIAAYASLPFYESLPEYIDAVNEYAKLGYDTFKFHTWCVLEEDSLLVESVQKTFADSPYRFMIDLEGAYDLEDALRLGGEMDEKLFVWFEGPIDDALLEQYRELRGRLAVEIIPAGYRIYSPEFIREGIETGAWDAARIDATTIGGISKALGILTITNDAGLAIEIQSWGHSLAQAANLHLMLANDRTRYFEAPMPKDAYEFGMKNGNLLDRRRVVAPEGPGLGIEVDWDRLATADFYEKFSSRM